MIINKDDIKQLKELLTRKSRITVVSHINPDGDALGSGLAWTNILRGLGHDVKFMLPNNYSPSLDWMKGIEEIEIFKTSHKECSEFIAGSEVIFFLDLNDPKRLDKLGDAVMKNTSAKKILIDHHLTPPQVFDIYFSYKEASSTCFLIYRIIEELGLENMITYDTAESLYVGISTDTGNFAFSNLTPELYCAVASLVEKGIDVPKVNNAIYNNFSVDRTRLMGYILCKKMKIMTGFDNVAYIAISRDELLKYNFVQGDSEGFVNIPLSIKGMEVSAFFMQTKEGVKVSLRSKGDIDVDKIARKYFNGGGHKNAAGGQVSHTLRKTVAIFRKAIKTEV